MKNGFLVFLISLVALGGSWCGFVLAPVSQLGADKQTTIPNSSDPYPIGRPGEANQGLQVYRANGCAACHTEQVQQSGVACDVILTDNGKNPSAVYQACGASGMVREYRAWPVRLPITVVQGVNKESADAAVDKITTAGGKAEIHIIATGSISRAAGADGIVSPRIIFTTARCSSAAFASDRIWRTWARACRTPTGN